MITSQILTSIILIICGFLVKKYPNLIAGYNTMSSEEKEKVNIDAVSTFVKQLLIGLGLITLLIFCVLSLLQIKSETTLIINTVIILLGVFIGLFYLNTNKTFKN